MSLGYLLIIEEAARSMMDGVGEGGLVIDGTNQFFEYSSKPTGGAGAPLGQESTFRAGYGHNRFSVAPSDCMCTICGCVNFARRTSCFQNAMDKIVLNDPMMCDEPGKVDNGQNARKGTHTEELQKPLKVNAANCSVSTAGMQNLESMTVDQEEKTGNSYSQCVLQ